MIANSSFIIRISVFCYARTMSTLKTVVNNASAIDFIKSVPDEAKQKDSLVLLDLYKKISGEQPKMWGSSMIGFGSYHYKSERSRQEGDWLRIGFSPRKQNLTLYFMDGFEKHGELLGKLGKHKVSRGCLYINKLSDVDMKVLEKLIAQSLKAMQKL